MTVRDVLGNGQFTMAIRRSQNKAICCPRLIINEQSIHYWPQSPMIRGLCITSGVIYKPNQCCCILVKAQKNWNAVFVSTVMAIFFLITGVGEEFGRVYRLIRVEFERRCCRALASREEYRELDSFSGPIFSRTFTEFWIHPTPMYLLDSPTSRR